MVYDILDQICKDTVLYPYIKQHKAARDRRGAFYAIHSRMTAPEAEIALQMSIYGEKREWNWENYVACHLKYHIILVNLMEYGYQWLDLVSKVWYLLNGIRCDKLSTPVATVRAHPDRYNKDFDAVVTFLSQYIDKKAPTSVTQTRPAKR